MKQKNIIKIWIIALFVITHYSCDSTDPKPPDTKPPGYQEDIVWPSLADSPWPMFRGDPQCTGRAKSSGPSLGSIAWSLDSIEIGTGFAFDGDSTIYFGGLNIYSPNFKQGGLYAVNFKGEIKWKYPLSALKSYEAFSNPLIDASGTIYIANPEENKLLAIKSDGTSKWEVSTETLIMQTGINIGKDNTIYVIGLNEQSDNYALQAISKSGELLWTFESEMIGGEGWSGMSFAPDGKTIYFPGRNTPAVIAFDIESQSIKWTFGNKRLQLFAIPLVDSNGNIYTICEENGNGFLYSIDAGGNQIWKSPISKNEVIWNWGVVSQFFPFAINSKGSIITGKASLVSINYEGKIEWEIELDTESIVSPILIDNNDNIFFILKTAGLEQIAVCYNSDSEKLSSKTLDIEQNYNDIFSLALGDGMLLYGDGAAKINNIIAIK